MPLRNLLHGAAEQHHVVGGLKSSSWCKSEFALAGTEFHFDRAQRQTERENIAPDDIEHRRHLVVALLGQVLVAVREQADFRRLSGLARVFGRHLRVFELEDVKLDLEAGDEIEAALTELVQHLAKQMPCRKRHRASVGEMHVAQQPAGRGRPGQHAEACGVGHHQHVGRAFHLRHAEAAAGGEHRKHRAVRGVLGEHRGGDGAAAFERGERLACDQRLAAQDAVLIGKRQADGFEFLFFDDAAQAARRLLLLARPKTVTLNEIQRVTPGISTKSECTWPRGSRRARCAPHREEDLILRSARTRSGRR